MVIPLSAELWSEKPFPPLHGGGFQCHRVSNVHSSYKLGEKLRVYPFRIFSQQFLEPAEERTQFRLYLAQENKNTLPTDYWSLLETLLHHTISILLKN